jgi:hypothetical protein
MLYKLLSLLLPNFAFVYILGMLFFFYLRLRYMRNILLTLHIVAGGKLQDRNIVRVSRKVRRVGFVVLLLLAAWVIILYQSWFTLVNLTEDRVFITIMISTIFFLAVFLLGAETVHYLVHDDDFSEQTHIK